MNLVTSMTPQLVLAPGKPCSPPHHRCQPPPAPKWWERLPTLCWEVRTPRRWDFSHFRGVFHQAHAQLEAQRRQPGLQAWC